MIKGTGIDIVEMNRIRKILDRKPRFARKILSDKEERLFLLKRSKQTQLEFISGRFAAKEALGKALGTGIGTVGFRDITVINDERGKPVFEWELPGHVTHLSISHSEKYTVAQVILERDDT